MLFGFPIIDAGLLLLLLSLLLSLLLLWHLDPGALRVCLDAGQRKEVIAAMRKKVVVDGEWLITQVSEVMRIL
jgi:hypothetical protein